MPFDQITTLVSLSIAAATLAFALLRQRTAKTEDNQVIRDKLDTIGENVRDTREDVRQLNRKLDSHGERLTRMEAVLEGHERRITKLES